MNLNNFESLRQILKYLWLPFVLLVNSIARLGDWKWIVVPLLLALVWDRLSHWSYDLKLSQLCEPHLLDEDRATRSAAPVVVDLGDGTLTGCIPLCDVLLSDRRFNAVVIPNTPDGALSYAGIDLPFSLTANFFRVSLAQNNRCEPGSELVRPISGGILCIGAQQRIDQVHFRYLHESRRKLDVVPGYPGIVPEASYEIQDAKGKTIESAQYFRFCCAGFQLVEFFLPGVPGPSRRSGCFGKPGMQGLFDLFRLTNRSS